MVTLHTLLTKSMSLVTVDPLHWNQEHIATTVIIACAARLT